MLTYHLRGTISNNMFIKHFFGIFLSSPCIKATYTNHFLAALMFINYIPQPNI